MDIPSGQTLLKSEYQLLEFRLVCVRECVSARVGECVCPFHQLDLFCIFLINRSYLIPTALKVRNTIRKKKKQKEKNPSIISMLYSQ